MATFNKTSFIPQKSLNPVSTGRRKPSVSLFFIGSVIIFIVAIALSIGAFSYKKILEQGIEKKAVSLQRAREAFDPGLIENLTRLDSKIEATKDLLDSHISLTPLFDFLEEFTLKNIKFDSFNLSLQGSSDKITLSIEGQAINYATIVAQSDLLGQSRFLKDQIFSNVSLDSSGNVSFSLDAKIDPKLTSFRSSVEGL
jgi:hypothetical protein